MLLDIIIFAAIATFVIIKLKSVLGNEYESDMPVNNDVKKRTIREIEINDELRDLILEDNKTVDLNDPKFIDANALPQMKKMQEYIVNIDAKSFIDVAKKVFELMLNGYANKDIDIIKKLSSEDIANRLINAINQAVEHKTKTINILITIDSAIIKNIEMNNNFADIYVAFHSQQINYSEDENKNIIDGNKSAINTISELWQFRKNLKDNSKQWILVSIQNA